MTQVRAFARFCADVNHWIARQLGLHWIDIWLWRRRAAQDEKLAAELGAAGHPSAAKMYRSATFWREMADLRAAWPRWVWK